MSVVEWKLEPGNYRGKLSAQEADPAAEDKLTQDGRVYEYTSAANPAMAAIPVLAHDAALHSSGPTRVIPFDLKDQINVPYSATSPNLLVSFIRLCKGESIATSARATSQAFYVISGRGSSSSVDHDCSVNWSIGDMIVFPGSEAPIQHVAEPDEDCAIYWVNDEPLLRYLGVSPCEKTFEPTVIRRARMLSEVERISHEPGAQHRNRMGVLLGNKVTDPVAQHGSGTLTLTPTLWSLLNVLPAESSQRPHRHNSVAMDLCVYSAGPGVYTLMGKDLDEHGNVKDPVRCDWGSGSVFVTPPGWWHSHHNETQEDAWVLPMQDAGLHTYMRTLDIQFAPS